MIPRIVASAAVGSSALRPLLELIVPSVCAGCDAPLFEDDPLLCAACSEELEPLAVLGGVATALAYRGSGRRLLQRFKFEARRDALAVLIEPLVERSAALDVDVVVPLPAHPRRLRQRGRDPVWLLARTLARRRSLPLSERALRRTRPTAPQTGLGNAERRKNVAHSFAANPRALRGRRVLLLDDVTTTGATLAEAARELRRASGARSVVPLALAGTPPMVSRPPA